MSKMTNKTPEGLEYFSIEEFTCSHTGEHVMSEDFLFLLDELRERCGFPFTINSGYRHPSHPVEASKAHPGTHTEGIAADIKVNNGFQRRKIVDEALKMDVFGGIGVAKDFVHVDVRDDTPVLWNY